MAKLVPICPSCALLDALLNNVRYRFAQSKVVKLCVTDLGAHTIIALPIQ